ncbi:hypothetical protein [Gemmata sp. SH-PL17]|uniref:hypothetical protein n=1 Tax=Gemmata sp. SH-PL17 TaxID=1630693 RepID=UPI0012F94830|nr:hypothetical protein [Gemmata sp. SH-PL17]
MVRATLESRFAPQRLDELFRRTARRQHTHEFLFAQRVQLMTATVLRQQPSVHAAYKNPVAQITVYDQAVYDKRNHLELGASEALVRDSAPHVRRGVPERGGRYNCHNRARVARAGVSSVSRAPVGDDDRGRSGSRRAPGRNTSTRRRRGHWLRPRKC